MSCLCLHVVISTHCNTMRLFVIVKCKGISTDKGQQMVAYITNNGIYIDAQFPFIEITNIIHDPITCIGTADVEIFPNSINALYM